MFVSVYLRLKRYRARQTAFQGEFHYKGVSLPLAATHLTSENEDTQSKISAEEPYYCQANLYGSRSSNTLAEGPCYKASTMNCAWRPI